MSTAFKKITNFFPRGGGTTIQIEAAIIKEK
jgi:hypothetical protein